MHKNTPYRHLAPFPKPHSAAIGALTALTALSAAALLTACGGDDSSASNGTSGTTTPASVTVQGSVVGTAMKNPTGAAASSASGVDYAKSTTGDDVDQKPTAIAYGNATVCADVNGNGVCDQGEASTTTAADGTFKLTVPQSVTGTSLVATVGTNSTFADPNQSGTSANVAKKMVLRSAPDQSLNGANVVISPLTTEVVRLMQSEKLAYADATARLAGRLSFNNDTAQSTDVTVKATDVVANAGSVADANAKKALLTEANALANRFALASTMLDRGYASDAKTDPVTTLAAAQDAAFNPEGIPRYDHLFVVIFENHSNQTIDNPSYPNLYRYLNQEGNKAANYFSTGNPSEPNYISLASADDWGVSDDSPWNCLPTGNTADAPTDTFVPLSACTNTAIHNLKNRRNLFTATYKAGLSTRVYSESMDPGQDPRKDGAGNSTIMGANTSNGTNTLEPMISSLYKTKHHPAVNFDDVRNRPDFFKNLARSVGGGQWDSAIDAYAKTNNITWNTHQFEDDLKSGDVGALNYIVPDQCDDMHATGSAVANCTGGTAIISRGDLYAKYLVEKIQASPVWKNTNKRSAIVMIFDEGTSFFGSSSCCGWNVGGLQSSGVPLGESNTTPVPTYSKSNRGDGPTIFSVLTNQPNAPKKVVDSDSYSHFSFVRTMQDMFALADPGVNTSYMNRSKYTEKFIADNLANLAEYSGSGDTHFDAVRPMNHTYVMKAGDRVSGGATAGSGGSGSFNNGNVASGPDSTQTNIFALR
ncbi:alkaline phosphatase family protein [Cupriavidus plantarum]|uniref:alkaline phosphatase family protein n=1 Tax=Cupriavidus plantarum TaxID=942865 RepID=UPI000E27827E|nr:alkaline phosphatase family protein [Cupriavidus plantarum]REE93953.1 phosphoesterase family protein [Cupriavidus plantarum]